MLCIGIVGNAEIKQTMEFLIRLYNKENKKVFCKVFNEIGQLKQTLNNAINSNKDIFIAAMNFKIILENKLNSIFDILIITSGNNGNEIQKTKLTELLRKSGILIINSDDKTIFPFSIAVGTTLISCGFNGRSSVTTSSMMDNKLQCCVQRNIKTISGSIVEPQEFTINLDEGRRNISSVLMAVTAAMADDSSVCP